MITKYISRPLHLLLALMLGVAISPALTGGALAKGAGLVKPGDQITFRRAALAAENNAVMIKWQQNFRPREVRYVQTAATYDAGGKSSFFILFIQSELTGDVLETCEDQSAKMCSLTVTGNYQYGQSKDKASRFLVYHDRSFKPYQHRFVNTTIAANFARGAQQLATDAGDVAGAMVPQLQTAVKGIQRLVGATGAMFGDVLKNF
ncbi:MAG: hypothetical protein C0605_03925 [Hyphomicrobiales bacterium]|nr:MAG: hypothetical protein C0605_03925 [Hyphomicrobiales bacterium]